ncbi:hypothetical protein JKI95_02450 [Corynebacterium aquatimens]|uniref:hypothetical protein n=1 Tax=Corynebacterium aquatimens TaxID=1190508 RepID=UPI0025410A8E|nr:hypothetical protein [Corynebacterium aquatimens]QYH20584.1 hypothetical protein JKI95_02450 [Corynebacterium aquatimens]
MTSLYVASKLSAIAGMATETMVESTRIMKNPNIIAQSADQGERPGWVRDRLSCVVTEEILRARPGAETARR